MTHGVWIRLQWCVFFFIIVSSNSFVHLCHNHTIQILGSHITRAFLYDSLFATSIPPPTLYLFLRLRIRECTSCLYFDTDKYLYHVASLNYLSARTFSHEFGIPAFMFLIDICLRINWTVLTGRAGNPTYTRYTVIPTSLVIGLDISKITRSICLWQVPWYVNRGRLIYIHTLTQRLTLTRAM